jgi:hypothetical protein
MPFVSHIQNPYQQTADNEEHDDVREQRAARLGSGAQGFSFQSHRSQLTVPGSYCK